MFWPVFTRSFNSTWTKRKTLQPKLHLISATDEAWFRQINKYDFKIIPLTMSSCTRLPLILVLQHLELLLVLQVQLGPGLPEGQKKLPTHETNPAWRSWFRFFSFSSGFRLNVSTSSCLAASRQTQRLNIVFAQIRSFVCTFQNKNPVSTFSPWSPNPGAPTGPWTPGGPWLPYKQRMHHVGESVLSFTLIDKKFIAFSPCHLWPQPQEAHGFLVDLQTLDPPETNMTDMLQLYVMSPKMNNCFLMPLNPFCSRKPAGNRIKCSDAQ